MIRPSARLLPLGALLTLAIAPTAIASTVDNGGNASGSLNVVPTAPSEANALTITYADGSGATPPGYTVHDDTTDVAIAGAGACNGCTPTDSKTVFVPAANAVTASTGNADSSIVINGQEPLPPFLNNILNGGAGNDVLTSGNLADTIDAKAGNDTINGGAGNDDITGGPGNDTVNGGAGSDHFETADGDGSDAFNGGPGVDWLIYDSKTAAVSATEDGAPNDGVVSEGDNVATIETVVGTAFADTIALTGSLSGGTILGLEGDDTITGSNGRETIFGGPGNDMIKAAGGNDLLVGGGGNDTLSGGTGADVLDAGSGNDTADGGTGDDRFLYLSDSDGADTWVGGPGDDSIDYSGESGPVTITGNGSPDDGSADEKDNVGADIESIIGTTDGDTITGGAVDNTLMGNGGADTLNGGVGNDALDARSDDGDDSILNGGDGADTLLANNGDNVLTGGAGDDWLNGGAGGADVLGGGPGVDVVTFVDFFYAGGVNISPNGVADDGRPGQGANVGADVENLVGSVGPDTIAGTPGVVNRVDGSGGGDTIGVASAPADADTVLCRSGTAGSSRALFAGSGDFNDVVNADALDRVSQAGTTACATVNRPAKHRPRAVVLSSVIRPTGRVFAVSFHCVSAVPRCRISAQIASTDGTVLGTGRAVIASGQRGQILFGLSSGRRLALARGKTIREKVYADVSDSSGAATSVTKTITLRAPAKHRSVRRP